MTQISILGQAPKYVGIKLTNRILTVNKRKKNREKKIKQEKYKAN